MLSRYQRHRSLRLELLRIVPLAPTATHPARAIGLVTRAKSITAIVFNIREVNTGI